MRTTANPKTGHWPLTTGHLLLGLFLALAPAAFSQPFGITAQVGSTTSAVSPGGTLNVAASAIGSVTPIRINITYRGANTATITAVDRLGSGDFSSAGVSGLPLTLTPSSGFTTTINYTPTSGQATNAQLTVAYVENTGSATAPPPSTFTINITGTAPDLVYTYAFSGGNAQAIGDGGLIQFPSTAVNSTRTANFTILNRGSAPGSVPLITLSGDAFQLGGLQIPPYTVAANSSLNFTVTFAPLDRTTQTGTLVINYGGKDYKISLQGTGTQAVYTYTLVKADNTTATIAAGQNIPFDNTNVGSTSTLTLRFANNGNGPGTISAISAVGNGFSVTNGPFLPLTLAIGQQAQVTLNFAPTTPGAVSGGLKIGDDTFTLSGTGVGPQLTYSYSNGGTNTTVSSGGTLQFTPVKVGASTNLNFTATNTGNAVAAINAIFLTGSNAFTLGNVPSLPRNLDPGATITFTVRFFPGVTGVSTGSLTVGGATFTVSGSASAPDPLPTPTLSGPSGDIKAQQQPSYKLSLKSAYSIDVVGTLNLSFSSSAFTADPAVQFATGGKTADFVIAAGTTDAVFVNNSSTIAIQTGTVAGTITLFPTFATTTGIDLTPTTVPVATLTIAPAAPVITNLTIASQSSTSLTLNITGYATGRSITSLNLTLTPAAGQNLTQSSFSIPVDSTFSAWYQTGASTSSGSTFTASLPLNLSGNSTAPSQLPKAIQSVAITLQNAQGISNSQSVSVP